MHVRQTYGLTINNSVLAVKHLQTSSTIPANSLSSLLQYNQIYTFSKLHVRYQKSYRGIGSVAEATGEQLGVFHGVCGQVNL